MLTCAQFTLHDDDTGMICTDTYDGHTGKGKLPSDHKPPLRTGETAVPQINGSSTNQLVMGRKRTGHTSLQLEGL
jgi:hypothetical protein